MIVTEFYKTREDGVKLNRIYSDAGMLIRQKETGNEYAEAIDVEGKYTYDETDIPIEDELSDSEALQIFMGRYINEPANGDQVS